MAHLGVLLLSGIVISIINQEAPGLAWPLQVIGLTMPASSPTATLVAEVLAALLASAVTAPFVSGVISLLYVDARIRSEGLRDQVPLARPTPAGTDAPPLLLRDLDPDGATAHQWLTGRLARPEYHQGPNPLQADGWLADRLGSLFGTVGGVPGGPMSILAVPAGLVVAVPAMLLRVRGDRGRSGGNPPWGALQGEPIRAGALSPARRVEARYGRSGRVVPRSGPRGRRPNPAWPLGRPHRPWRGSAPGAAFPDHAAALARSGDVFDVVLYGKQGRGAPRPRRSGTSTPPCVRLDFGRQFDLVGVASAAYRRRPRWSAPWRRPRGTGHRGPARAPAGGSGGADAGVGRPRRPSPWPLSASSCACRRAAHVHDRPTP